MYSVILIHIFSYTNFCGNNVYTARNILYILNVFFLYFLKCVAFLIKSVFSILDDKLWNKWFYIKIIKISV